MPIYFGGCELPESVDASSGAATFATARSRGLQPLAIPVSKAPLYLADHDALIAVATAIVPPG